MAAATVILAAVLGVVFVGIGVAKILDATPMRQAREHLGLPVQLFRLVGIFELLGGAGVMVGLHDELPVIGVLASVGLVALTIGAGFYHQKAGDPMRRWLPAVGAGSLAIFYAVLRIATI